MKFKITVTATLLLAFLLLIFGFISAIWLSSETLAITVVTTVPALLAVRSYAVNQIRKVNAENTLINQPGDEEMNWTKPG
jgi:hypothetical protein